MPQQVRKAYEGQPPIHPAQMPPRLNWAVMWVKGDRIIEKWCDDDFPEARRIEALAIKAGKTGATLRCANYFFPPPEKLRPHEKTVIRVKKVKGKKKRLKKYVWVEPLRDLNARGIFWCGYCIKLRRFEKRDGFILEDSEIFVPRQALYCPMCGITHEHGPVKKWNPKANQITFRRMRRGKGNRGRRGKG